MSVSKIRALRCVCCGSMTRGRQWHNRDKGYGLCPSCADWLRSPVWLPDGPSPQDAEEFTRCYGVEGVHFNVEENE